MRDHRKVGLTIGRQVDLAFASEEIEALALRLELGRERVHVDDFEIINRLLLGLHFLLKIRL